MDKEINTYTGRSYKLTLPKDIGARAPAPEVREIMMADGKTRGLSVTCPCGWEIIIDPKWYTISTIGGRLTVNPAITHMSGNGCGWAARITEGNLIPIEAQNPPES